MTRADGVIGRLMLGFVNACSGHPLLTAGFFGLLLGLVVLLWVEMLAGGPGRDQPERDVGGSAIGRR